MDHPIDPALDRVPDRVNRIDAAIKFLQDAGYEVFRAEAALAIHGITSVDHHLYLQYSKAGDGFANHLRAEALNRLARSQPFADIVDYQFQPTGDPDNRGWGDPTGRSQLTCTLKFFPTVRKEWRRR